MVRKCVSLPFAIFLGNKIKKNNLKNDNKIGKPEAI